MIDDAIYKRLTTFAGLTALTDGRWFPDAVEQGTALPCGAYATIDAPREYTLGNGSNVSSRRQFSCYARTAREARSVAEQVKAAFCPLGELVIQDGADLTATVEDERSMGLDITLNAYRFDVDLQFIYPDN